MHHCILVSLHLCIVNIDFSIYGSLHRCITQLGSLYLGILVSLHLCIIDIDFSFFLKVLLNNCGATSISDAVFNICGATLISDAVFNICGNTSISHAVFNICGNTSISGAVFNICGFAVLVKKLSLLMLADLSIAFWSSCTFP